VPKPELKDIQDLLQAFEYIAQSSLGHTMQKVTPSDEPALAVYHKLKEKYGIPTPR
jgi:hypothetical protein